MKQLILFIVLITASLSFAQPPSGGTLSQDSLNKDTAITKGTSGYNDIYNDSTILIAVGNKSIAYSHDCINWQSGSIKNDKKKNNYLLRAVGKFKGVYYAVGLLAKKNDMAVLKSNDGVEWDATILDESASDGFGAKSGFGLWSFASNDTIAVTCGARGLILISKGDDTWVRAKYDEEFENPYFSVKWTGKEFIIVGAFGVVLRSKDGTVWEKIVAASEEHLFDVVYENNMYVASGKNIIQYSKDGNKWLPCEDLPDNTKFTNITFHNGRFIASGFKGKTKLLHNMNNLQIGKECHPELNFFSIVSPVIYHSPDGIRWEKIDINLKVTGGIQKITRYDNKYVGVINRVYAYGSSNPMKSILFSDDSINWELK